LAKPVNAIATAITAVESEHVVFFIIPRMP